MEITSSAAELDALLFCTPTIHPVTGETIANIKKLARDPITWETWWTGSGKEFGNMAQGDNKAGTPGRNSIFAMTHDQIAKMPSEQTTAYAQIMVDFRLQK